MRERPTARVVLLDERERVLLMKIDDPTVVHLDDPAATRGPCWITPGGGLVDGENHEEAVRRELREETGIVGATIGPWVWTREARISFGDEAVLVRERFYLARIGTADVTLDYLLDAAERAVYRDHRWWTATDLRASGDRFAPPDLPALVGSIVGGAIPPVPLTIHRADPVT